MVQRLAVIAAATAVAAGVLAATLLSGSGERGDEAERLELRELDDVNPNLRLDPPDALSGIPVEDMDRGEFTRVEPDKIVRVTWQRATPLPQGVSRVEAPRAEVLFEGGRVLEVTADEGRFVAADRQPTSGLFRGNVIVTLRRAGPDGGVDFDDDANVETRVFIDGEARFDLVLNQIDTDDRVHLTGPRFEFFGQGLELNYNERRSRLERLSVARGDLLRTKPDAAPITRPTPADGVGAGDPRGTGPAGGDPLSPPQSSSPEADDPVTYYAARFSERVRITAESEAVELTGDAFELTFALEGGGEAVGDGRAGALGRSAEPGVGSSVWAYPEGDGPRLGRSLFTPSRDDVVIRWAGQLEVLPLTREPGDPPPEGLAGPSDSLLRVIGEPAVVTHAEEGRIEAAWIDYLASSGRVRAEPNAAHRVSLTSPELGTLTGARLQLDPEAGVGRVEGPGMLEGHTALEGEPDPAGAIRSVGEAFTVTWRDRLDLGFFENDPPPGPAGMDAGMGTFRAAAASLALRVAEFHGDAHASHPRFEMSGQRVRLDFADPAEPAVGGRTHVPRRVLARDAGVLRFTGDTPDRRGEVRGDRVEVTFITRPDRADDVTPDRLIARGEARITDGRANLEAQQIDARFVHPDDRPDGEPAGEDIALAELIAEDRVEVELPEEDLTLTGHRLTLDPVAETAVLSGLGEAFAVVQRSDGQIAGPRLLFDGQRERVRVPAGGTFEALIAPADRSQTLNVQWARSMSFDRPAGTALFEGEVRALAVNPDDVTELTADRLQVAFDPDAVPADATAPPDQDAPPVSAVREVRATGDALLNARSLTRSASGRPVTRLRVEGPEMRFINTPQAGVERFDVLGRGSMQVEDYRPAPARPTRAADAGRDTPERPVDAFTGRGVTLLLWNDGLTLDAADNDLLATGGIALLHRPDPGRGSAVDAPPSPDEDVFQLDAQRLTVDLIETGGLGVWLGDAPPQPEVRAIDAERDVRVVRGDKTIYADAMAYRRADDAIRFTGDPDSTTGDRFVRIEQIGQPRTPRARAVLYHLTEDRLQAFDVVGGTGVAR